MSGRNIPEQSRLVPPVGPDDHTLGPEDAALTLVEYGDFECPACGQAYRVLQDVLEELGDDVRFVFRHFPLRDPHPHADLAAQAAESVAARAGEPSFWAMHDILFENQDALEADALIAYAESADASAAEVADDLASGAFRARVERDVESGLRSGVQGTPAFFINGRRFTGDWMDPEAFVDALRDLMFDGHVM